MIGICVDGLKNGADGPQKSSDDWGWGGAAEGFGVLLRGAPREKHVCGRVAF